MARKVFVLALIFVATIGVAMAAEAPSSSPKSSPAPSSPKASVPVAETPKISKAPPTSSDSPAESPEGEDAVDVGAPALSPSADAEHEPAAEEAAPSGASTLKVSVVVAVAAAGFFAF